jgi:predicted RNA binding protein YcfA (HicA-like mRNA interferase family)
MKVKEIIKLVEKNGWYLAITNGRSNLSFGRIEIRRL